MKADITKPEVHDAIQKLRDEGKKTTIEAIRTQLGKSVGREKRGGPNTVRNYRDEFFEMERTGKQNSDNDAELAEFRKLWQKARDDGKSEAVVKYQELEDDFAEEVSEVERLAAELLAAKGLISELESERDSAACKFGRSTEELSMERAAGERAATKLATVLERHAEELNALRASHAAEVCKLRERLDESEKTSHEAALALVRKEAELAARNQRAEDTSNSPSPTPSRSPRWAALNQRAEDTSKAP